MPWQRVKSAGAPQNASNYAAGGITGTFWSAAVLRRFHLDRATFVNLRWIPTLNRQYN